MIQSHRSRTDTLSIRTAALVATLFLYFPFPAMAQDTWDVTVGNNFFSPSHLDIVVGDTVRWTNAADGGPMHDVTEEGFAWASVTAESFVFEKTFETAEEIDYFCTVHPVAMKGTISVTETMESVDFNAAFNDAWRNPVKKGGQGVFTVIYPVSKLIFMSWFTYDLFLPEEDIEFTIGDPGHRWYTAFGPYEGDTAVLDLELNQGGIFDSATPINQSNDGTVTLKAISCKEILMNYDIISADLQGEITLGRLVEDEDNIDRCEALDAGE